MARRRMPGIPGRGSMERVSKQTVDLSRSGQSSRNASEPGGRRSAASPSSEHSFRGCPSENSTTILPSAPASREASDWRSSAIPAPSARSGGRRERSAKGRAPRPARIGAASPCAASERRSPTARPPPRAARSEVGDLSYRERSVPVDAHVEGRRAAPREAVRVEVRWNCSARPIASRAGYSYPGPL